MQRLNVWFENSVTVGNMERIVGMLIACGAKFHCFVEMVAPQGNEESAPTDAEQAKVDSCAYYVKGASCAFDSPRPCYPEGACLPTRNRSTVYQSLGATPFAKKG